jgi:hypothetical protein
MTSDHELRELSKPCAEVSALVLWMFDEQQQQTHTIKQYNVELITAIKATRPTMKPAEYKSASDGALEIFIAFVACIFL